MSQAQGQGWGMGRRARRRGRLIEQLTPLPAGEGPDVPRLVHWGTEGTAVEPRVAAWERRLRALPRRIRRALQRHFALTLAELALLLALWQGPGWAATINVDGTTCTLADAITAANTDTATGGCPAGSGADTLVLPAFSTLTLTAVDNSTYGDNGLPVVSSTITIAGQGSTLERDAGAPPFRLLAVGSGGELTVQNLTLRGGNSTNGGGAVLNVGTLTLTVSTITGNTATNGGGAANYLGTLTMANSTASGNTATSLGGGMFNSSGGLILTTLTLTNSTLSGNTATSLGGGMFNSSGILTLTNSTLSGNTATYGGGMFNSSGTLTLVQTLISGNSAGTGAEVFTSDGAVAANAFNLFGYAGASGVTGFTLGASDIVPSVLLSNILDPILAFNGGPTQTHALVPGSPAVDAVVGSCPATDQRGFVRPSGVACDIGAVELGAQAPPVVTSQVSFVPLPDTFSTTTDATGCPGGFAGRFFFQAQLTNLGGSPPLAALKDVVAELTNGNLVQTADGGPAGVGSLQTVPEVEDLSDRVLEPTGTVTVPFVICLQSLNAFRFLVDVQGQELPPP
jgi:hypothetical protein